MTPHPESRIDPTEAEARGEKPGDAGPATLPRLLGGLGVALAAGSFWGVRNVVTRWTLLRVPGAAFDVVLLEYLVAAALLLAVGVLLWSRQNEGHHADR